MALLPSSWKPACQMKRIVLHWTAGGHNASALDKEHYHILIQGDGTLIRGDHTIDDNVNTSDDDYAAHTRGLNRQSIGVAVCCMANAIERPFKAGPFPMKKSQWEQMAAVTAELAAFYRIPVTRQTILAHGEVERILGVKQKQKWDPLVLPWNSGLGKAQVGDAFRAEVQRALNGT